MAAMPSGSSLYVGQAPLCCLGFELARSFALVTETRSVFSALLDWCGEREFVTMPAYLPALILVDSRELLCGLFLFVIELLSHLSSPSWSPSNLVRQCTSIKVCGQFWC